MEGEDSPFCTPGSGRRNIGSRYWLVQYSILQIYLLPLGEKSMAAIVTNGRVERERSWVKPPTGLANYEPSEGILCHTKVKAEGFEYH